MSVLDFGCGCRFSFWYIDLGAVSICRPGLGLGTGFGGRVASERTAETSSELLCCWHIRGLRHVAMNMHVDGVSTCCHSLDKSV